MFSSGPNFGKLKTNLRLAINRLRLLGKKKAELARKSQKEIADYIRIGKVERAKIRVEHIIREDYLVEAYELIEMYCDLVLARFGIVTQMSELDEGIAEAVSSLLWVAPRLQADIQELKIVYDLLGAKYGKEYAEKCRSGECETINEKLKHKMSVSAPPKKLVEKYIVEIAKNFGVQYEPDPEVLNDGSVDSLLDISGPNNLGGPQPMGFIGYPQPPMLPITPFSYPPMNPGPGPSIQSPLSPMAPNSPPSMPYGAPYSYNIPPSESTKDLNTDLSPPPYESNLNENQPQKPERKLPDMDLPELPNVPSDLDLPECPKDNDGDDVDFDDLSRRFRDLKRKP